MEERNNQQEKREDFRRSGTANRVMFFRVLAIGFVLYCIYGLVQAYMEGGPDAPSLTMVVISSALLGVGCVLVAITTYRNWKRDKAEAAMSEEEIAEMEALRAADEKAEEQEET